MSDLQQINVGYFPNDGAGDDIRKAFQKTNATIDTVNEHAAALPTIQAGVTAANQAAATAVTTANEAVGAVATQGINFDTLALANAAIGSFVEGAGINVVADGANNGYYVKQSGLWVRKFSDTLPVVARRVALVETSSVRTQRRGGLWPDWDKPSLVGGAGGLPDGSGQSEILFGADATWDNEFRAKRVQAHAARRRGLPCIDYSDAGHRHYRLAPLNDGSGNYAVVGYTDEDGAEWRFDVQAGVYRKQDQQPGILYAPSIIGQMGTLRALSAYEAWAAGPPADPANATGADQYQFITDPAALAALFPDPQKPLISNCIPEIVFLPNGRMLGAEYGNQIPGHNPEHSDGVFQTCVLWYTDVFMDGNLPATDNETTGFEVKLIAALRGVNPSCYMADGKWVQLPDGRVEWVQSMRYPSGKYLTSRGRMLLNPMAMVAPDLATLTPGTAQWGPENFWGWNFPMQPEYLGSEIRLSQEQHRTQPNGKVEYCRVIVKGDQAWAQTISGLPPFPNPDNEDYSEPTFVHPGGSKVVAQVRGNNGLWNIESDNDGLTWGEYYQSYFETHPASTNGKAELTVVPEGIGYDGHFLNAWNAASRRTAMALALSKNPGDYRNWNPTVVIDPRTTGSMDGPSQSYPNTSWQRRRSGALTGWVCCAYDRDRSGSYFPDGKDISATFTGEVVAGVLHAVGVTGPAGIYDGQKLGADVTGIVAVGTLIDHQISGTPNGDGYYQLTINQTIASRPMNTVANATTPGVRTYSEQCYVFAHVSDLEKGTNANIKRYTRYPAGPPYSP